MLQAVNPATGERMSGYEELDESEAIQRIERAAVAFRHFSAEPIDQRGDALRSVAQRLREQTEELSRLMAQEMGKPIAQGKAEIEKSASVCEYYATHAQEFLSDEPLQSGATESFLSYRPLGVLLAIMPWNFPFWQVFRAAAPALMAGNTVVLKHASNVPGCALAIERIFVEAGLYKDAFQTLLVSASHVPRLIEHPKLRAVTLTGSTEAGRKVAACAGQALKPIVLELGGSDPYLILEDADLEKAARLCAKSRLINSGQSCIAAKRFIVVDSVRKQFEARFLERLAEAKLGDPLEEATQIGPMARMDLRQALHEQVEKSVELGARCVLGGELPQEPGAFYPATLLVDVGPGMPAYEEELFGPVASLITARDEAHAIEIANDSPFGLGAAVFTEDIDRGRRIARDLLNAGTCCVNDFVRSDPRLPFGGIFDSGFGRELSHLGIREFVNKKTVVVDKSTSAPR